MWWDTLLIINYARLWFNHPRLHIWSTYQLSKLCCWRHLNKRLLAVLVHANLLADDIYLVDLHKKTEHLSAMACLCCPFRTVPYLVAFTNPWTFRTCRNSVTLINIWHTYLSYMVYIANTMNFLSCSLITQNPVCLVDVVPKHKV